MSEAEVIYHGKTIFSCRVHDTFFSRLKGLMFSSRLRTGKGIILAFSSDRQIDIHMLFVFFPLDIIWIDAKGKIVHIARRVKPFAPFVRGEKASYILEVNSSAAQMLNTGDHVIINLKREHR